MMQKIRCKEIDLFKTATFACFGQCFKQTDCGKCVVGCYGDPIVPV